MAASDQPLPPRKPGVGSYPDTQWSRIARAKEGCSEELGQLLILYREPMVAFTRKWNLGEADAEDLVSEFVARLLKNDFLREVSKERGMFRCFLSASLRNFLRDESRRGRTVKRGSGQRPISLHENQEGGEAAWEPCDPGPGADHALDLKWAKVLLQRALDRLKEEIEHTSNVPLGMALWQQLRTDGANSDFAKVARDLSISEGAARVAANRLRNRLDSLIRLEVRRTLADPESDFDKELQFLRTLFSEK